ncbi:AzlD domain-containing protein [Thioclava sp. BHET1]|nr:AzlD domain-containing protein [Thioclava sp. BHET1]
MGLSDTYVWILIVLIGFGSFLLRFSFLGLIGNRALPSWLLRHLRYTPVAVLPGLVAPAVLWPAATGGHPDPARLIATGVTVLLGVWTRNVLVSMIGGAAALYLGLWLI